MDIILRLYSQDPTGAALRQHFDEADTSLDSVDHISNLILESLQSAASTFSANEYGSDCLLPIRAILRASPEDERGVLRRFQVLKGSVTWLIQVGKGSGSNSETSGANSTQLNEVAGKIVNALIDVGQSFHQDALVKVILMMTETIRQQTHPHSQMFALLSRLLVIATSLDSVTLPDSSEEISGSEFRDIILDRICTAPWHPKSVLPIATVLGDVEMESQQLEAAVVKVMKQFKHIDAADLPALIYNLLLLSSKGHQRLVLRGILEFFDRLNAGGVMASSLASNNPRGAFRLTFSELSAIESTVILHFSFAVKQDQELGVELLKHMKAGKTSHLSTFSLTCLLTMARIHRFEDNILDYLKSSILTIYKDEERIQREPWVADFEGMSPPPILSMLRRAIKKIPFGMEQLTQSVVQFGVYIMDSLAPSSPWKVSAEKEIGKKHTPKTPNERACELGSIVLAETFKAQDSVRSEILDHIMSRIVTKSASTVFFLELLEKIVKESSEELEEHLPRIKESLDYLSFLSLPTAVRLMAAVKDVAKLNKAFRDSLILILRKALFSKNLESRQVALSGFLLLLEPSSSPQMRLRGASGRPGASSGHDSGLPGYTMEILGMLRRCLGQQGDVRLALYLGLMELVDTSPNLNPIIFEILQVHFKQFYDRTGTRLSPLKLEDCVGNSKTGGEPTLTEPLQFLMSGVVRSLVGIKKLNRRPSSSHDDMTADESQVAECDQDLDRILLGLEHAGLEDFELDKTSDFSMVTNIGVRNNMYASLLIGCYESAIEYIVLRRPPSTDFSSKGKSTSMFDRRGGMEYASKLPAGASQVILRMFEKMRKLHDIVREKAVLPRGKKIGPLGEASVLGLECITRLMENMFAECPPEDSMFDPEASSLKGSDDFVFYITNASHVSLGKLQTSGEALKDNEYDHCRRISSVIVREFLVSERADGPKAMAAGAKGKDKSKSCLMVGIEVLTTALLIIQRFFAIDPNVQTFDVEMAHRYKIACGFLAATLPQVNGGHQPDQQASEVVAWTTSRTIKNDLDSLAAAYIQYLQGLFILFVNENIPLLREAAGLLNMIQILSKYLKRASRTVSDSAQDGLARCSSALLRTTSSDSMDTSSSADSNQLDQLIHWLVRLCRDQALDDVSLTKSVLSMMLMLEQDCGNPRVNAALMTLDGQHSGAIVGAPPSLGFGSVSASSAVNHCPEAATRLRLASDIVQTYNINFAPNLHTVVDISRPSGDQQADEDAARLFQLQKEIGTDTRFAVVTMRTCAGVTDILLQQVDRALEGLEWALGKHRFCGLSHPGFERCCSAQSTTSDQATGDNGVGAIHSCQDGHCSPTPTKKTVQEFETEICWRIEVCLWILVRISQACIAASTSEHLIRVLHRCYKVLTVLTKQYLTPLSSPPLDLFPSASNGAISSSTALSSFSRQKVAGPGSKRGSGRGSAGNGTMAQLPHGFLRVTQVAGTELSKHLYLFLSYFQAMDQSDQARAQERQGAKGAKKGAKGAKDKMKAGEDVYDALAPAGGRLGGTGAQGGVKSRQKAKIMRESKLIPTLIFAVEQYERYVIQLSKKSKVNLTQFMRRSTARDFRIQIQRLEDLGLEDQYDEERQLQQLQMQPMQQQQPHSGSQDRDVAMEGIEADTLIHRPAMAFDREEDEDEEETLVRSRKKARHDP